MEWPSLLGLKIRYFYCPGHCRHAHSPSAREVALWGAREVRLGGGTFCLAGSSSVPARKTIERCCGCDPESVARATVLLLGSFASRGSGERHVEAHFPDGRGEVGAT